MQAKSLQLDLGHIQLAALAWGEPTNPPMLLLHGWLDNAASFTHVAPRLAAAGHYVVALDLPGHGYSQHRPAGCGYWLWDYVSDVLLAADRLGFGQFDLLGHSMGGIISVLLSASLPERVKRVLLIDGLLPFTAEACEAPDKLADFLRAQEALAGKSKPVYSAVEQAVKARMKGVGAITELAAQLLCERGLMAVEGGYTWRSDARLTLPSPLRLTRDHAMAFVRRLQAPTLLLLAEQGMLLTPMKTQLASLEAETAIHMRHLPGGHHLHLDSEEGGILVVQHLLGFLAELPAP
ncbi:alpha/beta hydrolase [Atopomonas sediminilitoris]|uniref:alpha/beta hydrolase n=1 Tax=Atopomonas sediminilitoris TaxID=2919919 RepID=UPI001F4DD793|nr:alpha/beta hydrolase [Atopomonas sediminilitoris]MCJ8167765.1 alpha/beta hydrolase [Atopomonas sediminilitoris]